MFDPDEVGFSQEDFDKLEDSENNELLQDWALGVEVEAEIENNPFTRKRWDMQRESGVKSYSVELLPYPSVDQAFCMQDRIALFNNAIMDGAKVILHTEDYGDLQAEAWLPRFNVKGFSGFGLCEDIAHLFAMDKLIKLRLK